MKGIVDGVRASYNKIANAYFSGARFFNEEIMHTGLISIATHYGFQFKGATVLDLGCGPGGLMKAMETRGALTYGLDISDKLLAIASERGCTNLTLGSMHQAEKYFNPHTFDAVFSNFALHYLPKEGQAHTVRAIYEILKPGGFWIYSCCHPFFMRHWYMDEQTGQFTGRTKNYFYPLDIDVWGEKEFGESLPLFRLDWPEIHLMNRSAGFDVLEMRDAVLPSNIEKTVLSKTKNKEVVELIQLFKKNPFGVFVAARKT
jgi:SAM-dependent methyltransferase